MTAAGPWGRLLPYVFAVIATVAAVLVRWLLTPLLPHGLPFITLYPAVAIAVWYGGWAPALLATLLGYLAVGMLFMESDARSPLSMSGPGGIVAFATYLLSSLIVIFLGSGMRRAQRRAEANEARNAAVLEAALDAIVTMDHAGRVVEFNPAAERTFGYRRDDVLGRDMADLIIPPSLRQQHRLGLARYLATGEPRMLDRQLELTAQRSDGTEFPAELSLTRLHKEGLPVFTAHLRDITARRRSEETLRAREAELELIASRTPLILTRCSRDRRYVYVNRAGAELLGRPAEQIVGRPVAEIMGKEAFAAVSHHIERVLAGEDVEFEMEVPYAHRGPRFVRATYTPDRDENGRVIGWVASVSDITERRRAELALRESETMLRFSHRAARAGTWTWEAASGLVTWSGECYELFGVDPQTPLLYESWRNALHPDDRERADTVTREAMERGQDLNVEYRIVHPERGLRWLTSIGRIIDPVGRPGYMTGISLDITERKQAEEALREADRRKDEFLATLAHELRNPLAPVRNALHILRLKGGLAPELQWARDVIDRQVQQMTRLIDDLMDISRITRDRLEMRSEHAELAKVIQGAVETNRALIESSGHELHVTLPDEPVYLEADIVRLAQVFSNLLNNAAKYSDRGSRIWLAAEQQDGEVRVSIRDEGIGIPSEMLPRIFEMFTQVDRSLERTQGGLGIGLTIVRRLVEMHGGSIEARSEGVDRGSEFIVRLPVSSSSAASASPSRAELLAPAAVRRRVLVVDDNADAAASLCLMLELLGYETRSAADGMAGLESVGQFRPHIALLDIGMPRMNGYDLARHIRQEPWGKEIVLIAVTGWGQEQDRQRTVAAGFDQHLVKPVDPNALAGLLAALP
jgi:PAS domain S-box-containing protein